MKIVLPNLPPKEANPNSNSHFYTRSRVRREQHEKRIGYVLEQGRPDKPFEKAHITITWSAKDKRKREIDNLLSERKGSIDGRVEADGLVDDSAKHLSYTLFYEWGDDIKKDETILEIKESK